uniref:Uncharacterized protein n=1 Tax=Anguilla anguilla TaxID=7936 RepID=A0A0E9VF61_ANGAN
MSIFYYMKCQNPISLSANEVCVSNTKRYLFYKW